MLRLLGRLATQHERLKGSVLGLIADFFSPVELLVHLPDRDEQGGDDGADDETGKPEQDDPPECREKDKVDKKDRHHAQGDAEKDMALFCVIIHGVCL